jgi:hypothetical protein
LCSVRFQLRSIHGIAAAKNKREHPVEVTSRNSINCEHFRVLEAEKGNTEVTMVHEYTTLLGVFSNQLINK